MNPNTTALVLIEYQNEFVKEGGIQHTAVKDVMTATNMFAHSQHLLQAARDAGVCVMHVPIAFAEGYPEIPAEPYGILAGIVGSGAFKKGSWGAEIVDEMQPTGNDIVIEGKRGLDCFASTNLDFILRARSITDVAIAGFLTNCCVESTMRSAYERGYRVVTVVDCTATLSEEEQRVATEKDFAMFSRPMTHTAFLAELS
jgi:nicotinamidase-related amidase